MTLKKKSRQADNFPGQPVELPDNMTVIGRIARPVGVKGELKLKMESALPDRILEMKDLLVKVGKHAYKFPVESIKGSSGWYRLKLKGIDNPEDGSALSGCELLGTEADRPKLAAGEYYIDDLIGCMVESDKGDDLGMLMEVMSQGHHDIWMIDGEFGEIMIPAVGEFVLNVDTEQHKILVREIEGLWDKR